MMGIGISLVTKAQGAAWSPAQLSGLALFFRDGADYNATTGIWTDRSGNGRDYSAPASKPTASTINGVACVHFTQASSQRLEGTLPTLTAGEIFFVTKSASAASMGLHNFRGASPFSPYYPHVPSASILEAFCVSVRQDTIGVPVTLTNAHVYNVRCSAAGAFAVAFDGAADSYTASATFQAISTSNSWLGENGDGVYYDGDIGSVVMFDRVLTSGERAQVNDYLRTKWGTP